MSRHLFDLALLARQTAKDAKRDQALSDLADLLYITCVQAKVPMHLLPR